jgi:hypothetical protein
MQDYMVWYSADLVIGGWCEHLAYQENCTKWLVVGYPYINIDDAQKCCLCTDFYWYNSECHQFKAEYTFVNIRTGTWQSYGCCPIFHKFSIWYNLSP